MLELFPADRVVGIFKGFSEGGLEFHADLVFPYRNDFQATPMHGQFVLVQLDGSHEAVLGRISSLSADGKLSSSAGEDFNIRAVQTSREIPEDLREQYLKYRVNIRVLGVVRTVDDKLVFVASQRRLPHVGSKVAFPSDEVLRHICGHYGEGAPLGHLALGEYIYAGDDPALLREDWMQIKSPAIVPKFDVRKLVSRRSFVFARAGFGKSNLTKLLFSGLYKTTPTIQVRGGKVMPVGTIIFDIDGEYFWPDPHNRPGLCDVGELEDKIVVFTNKEAPSEFYGSFVAEGIKLDVRRFRPADVVSIALSPEKQDQQNVRKLKGLNDSDWAELVNAVWRDKNATDLSVVKGLLKLEEGQDAEALAARANVTTILNMLHDPQSRMIDSLIECLRAGKLVIIDVSQLRGQPALILSGLILQRIFDINQSEFVKKDPKSIPTIVVLEEAQTVLGNVSLTNDSPYVAWVKEGRKYDLGAFLITQQPGSIAGELLSQGDNWFIFHLLSENDLVTVKRANAHFSNDLLRSLLNEPIPGHAVFWSSVGGKPYPLSIRIQSFEALYKARDPEHNRGPAEKSFAAEIRARRKAELEAIKADAERAAEASASATADDEETGGDGGAGDGEPVDSLELIKAHAIEGFAQSEELQRLLTAGQTTYKGLMVALAANMVGISDGEEREQIAYSLVPHALTQIIGPDGVKWHTERRESRSYPGRNTTWVVLGPGKSG